MKYEEALREWGAQKIEQYAAYQLNGRKIDRATVRVQMDFDEGYACCGGSDPDCYCSFATSPSADVVIHGSPVGALSKKGKRRGSSGEEFSYSISHYSFDFAEILGEIVAAADGVVTGAA